MNDLHVGQRETGRTSRMLAAAREAERQGWAVYVIAASDVERKRIRGLLPVDTTIKVETPSSPGNFEWHTLTLRAAHPNTKVFVDHHAIESQFDAVLQELHRYDA